MKSVDFSTQDIEQISERGITPEAILGQIEMFKRGFPYARLLRPCTVGDGIHTLRKSDLPRLMEVYSGASMSGRAMKFVPASGAATRMFKALLSVYAQVHDLKDRDHLLQTDYNDPDVKGCTRFIRGLKKFAFYEEIRRAMARDGLDLETLLSGGGYQAILEYVLTGRGLNLADTPKGLIKFHRYPSGSRTPFEEHLVEGAAYTRDKSGLARIHFAVSPEHESIIRDHVLRVKGRYEVDGVSFEVGFSTQKSSTDTLAADMDNKPFRDSDGKLLFRPGGHGALLENLNDLKGDILFIKNIDNVVPDRLKQDTYTFKKALGGYLVQLQDQIFAYLKRIRSGDRGVALISEAMEFSREQLSAALPERAKSLSKQQKVDFLASALNRPLRVCGMVKNQGEPGGGPFWVEHGGGRPSLQIIESNQVDMESKEQKKIWKSSTHFNPVDLICGVRDSEGSPFDLMRFRDPNTGFISIKSRDGKQLNAIELPGLWNGAMANWITVFVEVPVTTFAPVKTILDLLREEHQP